MSANLILDSALRIGRVSSRCEEEELFSVLKLHACLLQSYIREGFGFWKRGMFYANTAISQVSLRIHSLLKNLPRDEFFLMLEIERCGLHELCMLDA